MMKINLKAVGWVKFSFEKAHVIGTRYLHHSATNGKFYTNRFYVKKCSKCQSLNSLTLISCHNCSNALTDSDIRFRSLDHICEASNARKNMHTSKYLNINGREPGTSRHGDVNGNVTGVGGVDDTNPTVEDMGPLVLYRCFDFTIIRNRNPSSLIHLSAFPNGTFYDIKNFRKSHIELIYKMTDRCLQVFDDITGGKIQFPNADRVVLSKLKVLSTEGVGDRGKRKSEYLRNLVFGFNYPNTHCHVDMHALLPPIENFNLFKSPFFYTLEKVLGDLKNFGRVRQYSPSQIRQKNEFDEVMDQVRKADSGIREYLSRAC